MTVIGVTSARSSPGATSLAVGLAMAWRTETRPSLLIEADPAGGVIGLRFNLRSTPSLSTLIADMRHAFDPSLIVDNAVDLQGVKCLLAPVDPVVAERAVEHAAELLAPQLKVVQLPTVIDLGRCGRHSLSLPLAVEADLVLVVVRPRVDEVQSTLFTVRTLKAAGCSVGLVSIGKQPHPPEEVARLAGVPLIAVLPEDAKFASPLAGGHHRRRRFRRSLLWRSIDSLATALLDVSPRVEQSQNKNHPPAPMAVPRQQPVPPGTGVPAGSRVGGEVGR